MYTWRLSYSLGNFAPASSKIKGNTYDEAISKFLRINISAVHPSFLITNVVRLK